ncbi:Latent-transforming growth factor beta-binding protein 4 [Bagarius yarrelli]|uniref:Latent-transforming growth factor beta-binding protein 4 n=1 Tax=Bagarius yarrelli TaxID=175774 RepID=A0A556V1W5_BAGYA|nr:Latent-transforming growth factor beta-binding protein 4 [Bagarius yarrelli]
MLLKHIEAERNKLQSCNCTEEKTSTKTFYSQNGQYTLLYTPGWRSEPAGFSVFTVHTPTICRLRCSNRHCTNYCERGNITTLYSNEDATHTSGFRVFLCPMLCKNGGVCIQKDRCLCPSNFTGKFCHIPASSSSTANDIERQPSSGTFPAGQVLMHSEYVLPLQSRQKNQTNGKVNIKLETVGKLAKTVHHPPEATVKIHQVVKVTSSSSEMVDQSSGLSGSHGNSGHRSTILVDRAEGLPALVQAQTFRGDSIYTEASGFKYCFREVRNGKCSSPLPGLRSQETCCKGEGLAWGIKECTLCPPISAQKVISDEKDQCFRIVSQGVCSMPILKNITKQICCCSRVGKAWGKKCEACPYFGSVEFKEICPAGPGYHYSPNTLKLNQRVTESLSPALVSQTNRTTVTRYDTSLLQSTTRNEPPQNQNPSRPQSATISHNVRIQQSSTRQRQPVTSEVFIIQSEPQRNQYRTAGGLASSTSQPSRERPNINECLLSPRPCLGGQCENTLGSFQCVCSSGYRSNAQQNLCSDIDECRLIPNRCTNGRCENTLGSFRCVCRTGYKLQNTTCTDIDECDDPLRCPGQECINTQGSYNCVSCKPGFGLLNGQCTDIDECRQRPTLCSSGRCENTPGSYRCVCNQGFKLQGNICTDVNECEDPLQCPGQGCVNTLGSYRYINECQQVPAPCTNGRCENTPGSYRCVCQKGYKLQDNTCIDVNECENELQCPGQTCVNSVGSFKCVSCSPGFKVIKGQCEDVNECDQTPPPCSNGRCENTPGSFTYVDECESSGICGPMSVCVNMAGSYKCECLPGFRAAGPGRQCRDVNECLEGEFCFPRGECVNTDGSYMCVCAQGYHTSANGTLCIDVNECVDSGGSVCGSQRCENTIGSFRCFITCEPGYSLTATGECVDINECANESVCGHHMFCRNLIGTYQCICDQGYEATPDGRSCIGSGSSSPLPQPGDGTECYSNVNQRNHCAVLSSNTTVQECCCTVGRAWGLKCQYTLCPQAGTYVDECKLFDPEVCKGGVCVNNIPGYSCYCPSGYYYDTNLLECIDNDECESGDMCPGGLCVNTLGSYYCTCEPPLVLDDTQRSCVNNSGLTVEEYEAMCSTFGPPPNSPRYAERFAPVPGGGGGYRTPYGAIIYPESPPASDYDDYGVRTGHRSGLRTRPEDSYTPFIPPGVGSRRYYEEEDYDSAAAPPFAPDPRNERFYGSRFIPGPVTEGDEDEESWRVPAPFPSFTDRRPGSERPQRFYERRYESFAGLSEDECGILQGCENGRCVRVNEGYTCDCYDGYQLDISSMTCLDVDECDDPSFPECVNARCVNTEGSYRCVCLRGFTASRRPNYCIPA